MSDNGYVAPVDHGKASAVATVAGESASAGIRGAITSWLWSGSIIGAALFALPFAAGTLVAGALALTGSIAFSTVGTAALVTGAAGFTGAMAGGIASFTPWGAAITAGAGALFGLAKGTKRGVERVGQEQGAYNVLTTNIQTYKAQAIASGMPTTRFASHMSTAPSRVQAGNDNLHYEGRLAGAELAAAR
jgi:hypothetical protein